MGEKLKMLVAQSSCSWGRKELIIATLRHEKYDQYLQITRIAYNENSKLFWPQS